MMRRKAAVFAIVVFTLISLAAFCSGAPLSDEELKTQFAERWKFYFGEPKQEVSAPDLSGGQPREYLFRELWRRYSANLEPQDRPSAEAIMRYRILGDKKAYQSALKECLATRRFSPSKNGGILYYIFLDEEMAEKSVIQLAVPPGENGDNFYGAISQLGENEAKVRTRLAVFIFRKLIEEKLLRSVKNELPLMWFSTKGFAPSEAVFGRILLSDSASFIKGEFNEEASQLKLISILTELSGEIIKIGIGNPGDGPVLIPADGSVLYLLLFNPGNEEQGQGLTGTFWKDYNVPLSVEDVSMSGQFLRIDLQENEGIFGYTLCSVDENGKETGLNEFPFTQSSGEGGHSYFYSIPGGKKLPGKLSLKAYTFSGFTFSVPVQTDK
jgi:hypothetical protein